MKVHHVMQIIKGSLLYQNLIFPFVSFLAGGLTIMLLPKRLFQFGQKWLKFLISGKNCLNPNNLLEGDMGKTKVMNLFFFRWMILLCLYSFVSLKKQKKLTVFLLLWKQVPHRHILLLTLWKVALLEVLSCLMYWRRPTLHIN